MTDQTRDPGTDEVRPVCNRREFIRNGVVGVASISFAAMLARREAGAAQLPYSEDYGPVAPVNDLTTGLPLIALPAGFTYRSFGWTGQPMSDGQLTPSRHDGMAVVAAKASQIVLVRNHEQSTDGVAFNAPAAYDPTYARGGTTNVLFDTVTGKFTGSHASLTGTVRNCDGGRTYWGSWLSCEETGDVSPAGVRHGWIFEVPGYGAATGQPLYAMGKSAWEAVAVDPITGIVYQTEDATPSALYKFVPNHYGKLQLGGTLWALKVAGADDFNFSGLNDVYLDFPAGTTWDVEWVQVTDVEALNGRVYDSAPSRAAFARLEGAYYDSGKIYFVSTSGGVARQGQVFCYDPNREALTMVFNSAGAGVGNNEANNPDTITVSPRGGIVLCEDGGNSPQRLRGLTQDGGTFIFAENRMNFTAAQLQQADTALNGLGQVAKLVSAGNYANTEWCGACFYDRWLFANLQTPGITLAITGPWDSGAL
ncbi:alkaline phosphatase PhoX [Steroidobacter cummioxidans]|uniref:alkaline phosphatase PhoX n=1 Tax=Steroidobacter cummioxidans TaxID=1803913 RepID=UPI000E30E55C|nr:alkaline phosphatase PhoX [Steroidobacter cummioxidans]